MAVFIFLFGLTIGSFLNVLIFRLPENKSILGFSKCRKCKKRIAWPDNIPILSFLLLRGRCRNCNSKISFQYPLVELLTSLLFLISFFVYGENPLPLIYILFLVSLLIVIAFIDFKHFLILDSLILSGFIVSALLIFNFQLSIFNFPNCEIINCFFKDAFWGASFFAGIYLFLFLISRGKWLGFGDVKLAALLGFTMGLKNSVDIFYLTFLIGFIFAIILLVFKKAGLKTEMPLGTLMAGASILFLLSGFSFLDLINSELILRLWLKN
ncbi:MAG: leader peptidase (prepilin peptidase) / N-methyltransferase [Parcubacteria group bacterium Gr01-1014_2]|nr:MAG: leader peptidase (prepilin peptidase) / N-methyltransferase [Parcubacteria group bacterium Gr01-1014_2]